MKYFEVNDGAGNNWNCRALPFDRDLIGFNRFNMKSHILVSEIPKDLTAAQLEEKFKAIAPVKSAKISVSPLTVTVNRNGENVKELDLSQPPVSNGYGFVCFHTSEDAYKALAEASEFKVDGFQIKDSYDSSKVFNNIYVKNFNPDWNEEVIRSTFDRYGEIKSIYMNTKADKEGN